MTHPSVERWVIATPSTSELTLSSILPKERQRGWQTLQPSPYSA